MNSLKIITVLFGSMIACTAKSQSLGRMPDSVRIKLEQEKRGNLPPKKVVVAELSEEMIKDSLWNLTLKNPGVAIADANIRLAEIDQVRAKNSWMSLVNAGANINEFVIKGSAAASFFPKYNLGVTIPLDVISKNKNARKTANENLIINKNQKQQELIALKAELFTRYENYKERKQLLELEKIALETDQTSYENAQQDYAEGTMSVAEMNRAYQSYINEKSKLVSRQRDLNVAIISLEQMIGVPLTTVIP